MTARSLDALDDVDRKIIAALQQDGRAAWTDIAQRLGISIATVSRRGTALLNEGVVRVSCMPAADPVGSGQHVAVGIRCAPGEQHRVAALVASRPDVRFLAIVTGSVDLLAEIVVERPEQLHHVLIEGLQAVPGVVSSEAILILHTYKVTHDWSRHLLPEGDLPQAAPAHECEMTHFDDVDLRILDAMREDGRVSFKTVAAVLGVNESTVRRRYEAMSRRGCVLVVALVPAAALGFEAEIMLSLDIRPAHLADVARQLSAHTGVRFLAATLEQKAALLCEVILPTPRHVFEFTTKTLARMEGVQGWSANVELLTVKRGFVLTPWALDVIGEHLPGGPLAPAGQLPRG